MKKGTDRWGGLYLVSETDGLWKSKNGWQKTTKDSEGFHGDQRNGVL